MNELNILADNKVGLRPDFLEKTTVLVNRMLSGADVKGDFILCITRRGNIPRGKGQTFYGKCRIGDLSKTGQSLGFLCQASQRGTLVFCNLRNKDSDKKMHEVSEKLREVYSTKYTDEEKKSIQNSYHFDMKDALKKRVARMVPLDDEDDDSKKKVNEGEKEEEMSESTAADTTELKNPEFFGGLGFSGQIGNQIWFARFVRANIARRNIKFTTEDVGNWLVKHAIPFADPRGLSGITKGFAANGVLKKGPKVQGKKRKVITYQLDVGFLEKHSLVDIPPKPTVEVTSLKFFGGPRFSKALENQVWFANFALNNLSKKNSRFRTPDVSKWLDEAGIEYASKTGIGQITKGFALGGVLEKKPSRKGKSGFTFKLSPDFLEKHVSAKPSTAPEKPAAEESASPESVSTVPLKKSETGEASAEPEGDASVEKIRAFALCYKQRLILEDLQVKVELMQEFIAKYDDLLKEWSELSTDLTGRSNTSDAIYFVTIDPRFKEAAELLEQLEKFA